MTSAEVEALIKEAVAVAESLADDLGVVSPADAGAVIVKLIAALQSGIPLHQLTVISISRHSGGERSVRVRNDFDYGVEDRVRYFVSIEPTDEAR